MKTLNQPYFNMNIGDKYTVTHVVTEKDTAVSYGSGGLPVYATPAMICLMEKTAYRFAAEEGLQTVGTKVNISHLRACKAGTEVTCIFISDVHIKIGLVQGFHTLQSYS